MKILIIKLGALGDVVRTLSILQGIKENYPDSDISWVTKNNAIDIFEGNPYVKNIFTIPYKTEEEFDILYNFDIEKEATELAIKIKANKKYGFYSEGGYPAAFNLGAEYYLSTIFEDEYKKQSFSIYLNEKDKKYAENFLKINGMNQNNLIGIHIGSSPRWPSKAWDTGKIIEFIVKLKEKRYNVIVFAGYDDKEKQAEIAREVKKFGLQVFYNNPNNTIKEFASLINLCKKIVCADSLALHISLALKKPTIALFFCTSPDEVEGYDLLKKIVSPMLKEFFPERMDEYEKELINSINADTVLEAVLNE